MGRSPSTWSSWPHEQTCRRNGRQPDGLEGQGAVAPGGLEVAGLNLPGRLRTCTYQKENVGPSHPSKGGLSDHKQATLKLMVSSTHCARHSFASTWQGSAMMVLGDVGCFASRRVILLLGYCGMVCLGFRQTYCDVSPQWFCLRLVQSHVFSALSLEHGPWPDLRADRSARVLFGCYKFFSQA